jgi:hypothetical protein
MLEKTRENQDTMVQELQTEVKSLKKMLVNRIANAAPVAATNLPSASSVQNTDNAAAPSIPAWQLEALEATKKINESKPKAASETSVPVTSDESIPDEVEQVKEVKLAPSIPAWQLEAQNANNKVNKDMLKTASIKPDQQNSVSSRDSKDDANTGDGEDGRGISIPTWQRDA